MESSTSHAKIKVGSHCCSCEVSTHLKSQISIRLLHAYMNMLCVLSYRTIKTPLTIRLDEKEKMMMTRVSNEQKRTRKHNSLPNEQKTNSAEKDKEQLDENKASIGFFMGLCSTKLLLK